MCTSNGSWRLTQRGTAGTSVSSSDQRRVDTPCSWRIHPAGSGAEEEAIRTTPFGDVEDEMHSLSLLIALELTAPWIDES